MNLPDLLKQVLDIKGVTSAAVVNDEGLVVESATKGNKDLGFVGNVIAGSLTSTRMLADLLGDGEVNQTMIEYEDGPVLLVPLKKRVDNRQMPVGKEHVIVTTLDSINTLGRVRFQLRKLIPDISHAVSQA